MKLKLGEDGNAVLDKGYPVYVNHKNEEITVDINALYKTVGELKEESKKHRLKAKDYKASLTVFEGIEDLAKFKEDAESAIRKVADFADKDLVAADKVAELKSEWERSAESTKQKLVDSITEKEDLLNKKSNTIRQLLVSNAFAVSPFFTGKKPKTILPPDVAEARFGNHFKIEEDKNGNPQIVAYTVAGMPISSIKNPGENATFEEAISEIIEQYPGKDRILPAGNSGSGASGGSGQPPLNQLKALQEQHAQALKVNDIVGAITIKNEISKLQNQP